MDNYHRSRVLYLVNHTPETYIVFGTRVINLRANLLAVEAVFDQSGGGPVLRFCATRTCSAAATRSTTATRLEIPGDGEGAPSRKTLKEMEEELDLDEPLPREQPKQKGPQQ